MKSQSDVVQSTCYHCRVCGLRQESKVWGEDGKSPTFEMCACCGVEFGYEDSNLKSIRRYRENWLAEGHKWLILGRSPLTGQERSNSSTYLMSSSSITRQHGRPKAMGAYE